MARLSPRIKTNLPVKIESKSANTEMIMTDLSLDGAFIKNYEYRSEGRITKDSPLLLHYYLPSKGIFEHRGQVIRSDQKGYAISFRDVELAEKIKLWEFIAEHMDEARNCPYCGKESPDTASFCSHCGWDLNFKSPQYFAYYEQHSLLNRLNMRLAPLDTEKLLKICRFIDQDIEHVTVANDFKEFIGTSAAMLEVFSQIRKVGPTDLTTLILGESGTGKELTALAIHERSPRKDKPFIAINCAAIPETLLEAELFGYERGAFTGAYTSKKGKFECADSGTLFLDEVGDMPLNLQAKLLRFLQDRTIERIGGVGGRKVNVRLLAATNCDLNIAIAEGRFRSDLYYRLDEFTIKLPPLRERGEDPIIVAKYFLKKFSREMGMEKSFADETLEAIRRYPWPGNVREIINHIRKAIVLANGSFISPADMGFEQEAAPSPFNLNLADAVEQFETEKIREVLAICNHNISKAAIKLGLSRPTLHSRLKKYGL